MNDQVSDPSAHEERHDQHATWHLDSSPVTRRALLAGAVIGAGVLALGLSSDARLALRRHPMAAPLPSPSGIQHIIWVMLENRSFDHLLGWLPHADGRQEGLSYVDKQGISHSTYHLTDYQNCGHPDPDHSYAAARAAYAGGKCDGWLLAGHNDTYSIGYYTQHDLAFLGGAAPDWTTCDRYFAAIMAETLPNRIYQHAAQTDRLTDTDALCTLPTIWDRLADAGLTGRYYYSDVPMLALWGRKYLPIGRHFDAFLTDCAQDTLPHVAYVDPHFLGAYRGTSDDDHPFSDVRNGEAFLDQVYTAVTQSPAWPKSVLVISFDEWGGFFDHVAPAPAPIPTADQAAGNQDGLRGFRVPCLVISPWSPRRAVSHTVFDHTSVLKLIEWRFGLAPLSIRDRAANNLAQALDFSAPSLDAPPYVTPPGPYGSLCVRAIIERVEMSQILRQLVDRYGWPVP